MSGRNRTMIRDIIAGLAMIVIIVGLTFIMLLLG